MARGVPAGIGEPVFSKLDGELGRMMSIGTVKGVEVKHVYLHKDRATLGHKAENDIVLDTMVVSGRHCAFERERALLEFIVMMRGELGRVARPLITVKIIHHEGRAAEDAAKAPWLRRNIQSVVPHRPSARRIRPRPCFRRARLSSGSSLTI